MLDNVKVLSCFAQQALLADGTLGLMEHFFHAPEKSSNAKWQFHCHINNRQMWKLANI
jgi:hypothetical protein